MAAVFPSLFAVPAETKVKGMFGKAPSSNQTEMKAGSGRYVVLLMVAMEHGMLLFFLVSELFLTRPPMWVRNAMAGRAHEANQK